MVGHLIDAVVWYVCDGHAKFGGGVNRDVIDSHAEAAHRNAFVRRL